MGKEIYNVEGIEIEVEKPEMAYAFKMVREQFWMNRKDFSWHIWSILFIGAYIFSCRIDKREIVG